MTNVMQAAPAQAFLSDDAFLLELRRQMTRFATLQLGDAQGAEDAVQEALIGALKNAASFGARAAFKTWVFAILRNKIADALRSRQRAPLALAVEDEDDQRELAALFDERGHWRASEAPTTWADPEGALRATEFWAVFEACLNHLPAKQARAFMMREFVELDADEICASMGVSTSNLHVLLHRARLRLRECLENRWFSAEERRGAPC